MNLTQRPELDRDMTDWGDRKGYKHGDNHCDYHRDTELVRTG